MSNTRSTRSSTKDASASKNNQHHHQLDDVGPSGNQPPPFLTKTFDMVSDPRKQDVVSWSPDGRSFTVWNLPEFSKEVLPLYFKHNNFSSFVRQLNTYGFRKSDPDQWQFSNERFIRGRKDLLRDIHRRKTTPGGGRDVANVAGNAAIEVGSFGGIMDEVQALKRDKNVLMLELVRLRQQQQASEKEVRQMAARMEATEMRQHNMMAFLAKAVNNPAFLQQVLGSHAHPGTGAGQRITDAKGRKKRRATRGSADAEFLPGGNTANLLPTIEDPMRALVSWSPSGGQPGQPGATQPPSQQQGGEDDISAQLMRLLHSDGNGYFGAASGIGDDNRATSQSTGAEPELEGLSDESPPNEGDTPEAWGKRSDVVSDVGSAFDGLNLTAAVPSQVTIEHLAPRLPRAEGQPNGGDAPRSHPSPAESHRGGIFGADVPPLGPAPMPVNTFGMPEILPNPPLHDSGTYLPNGGLPNSSRDGGAGKGPYHTPFDASPPQGPQQPQGPHQPGDPFIDMLSPSFQGGVADDAMQDYLPDVTEGSQAEAFWRNMLASSPVHESGEAWPLPAGNAPAEAHLPHVGGTDGAGPTEDSAVAAGSTHAQPGLLMSRPELPAAWQSTFDT